MLKYHYSTSKILYTYYNSMSQCKVWLDNYNQCYYPGSVIQGRLMVNLSTNVTVRGVKVRVVCTEHTSWMGEESYYDEREKSHRTRTVQFYGDKDVLFKEIMLYGGEGGTTTLNVGQHLYPFSVTLPQDIPGSFQCPEGTIEYKVMGVVDIPMAPDFQDMFIFIVNSPVDLNLLGKPDLLEPTSYSDEKTVCCLCCNQGGIVLDVELPKRTLVPDETVAIKVGLTNMSNVNVEALKMKLIQKIEMKVTTPENDTKQQVKELVKIKEHGVGAHGEYTYFLNVSLPPNVVIPNFSMCSLFKVDYKYEIEAELPSCHSNLEVKMYPFVGHIPIGTQLAGAPSYSETQMSLNPTSGMAPNIPPIVYPPGSSIGWTMPIPSAPPGDAEQTKGKQAEELPPSYDSLNMP